MKPSQGRSSGLHWSIALVAGLAFGCDDDRRLVPLDDAGADAGADASPDASLDSSMDASASPVDALQGLWEGVCAVGSDDDGGVSESTRQGFAFRGDQIVTRIERYFDPTCVTPIVRLELSGSFTVGDVVSNIDGARELDVAVSGLTAQILDADFEDLANAERFLGFDDWDADEARDVLSIDVFGTGDPIDDDSTVYQIFQIVRVSDGDVEIPVLYFGDEAQGGPALSEERRPTALSNVPHAYDGPAL